MRQRFGRGLDLERLATHVVGVFARGVLLGQLAEVGECLFGFLHAFHDLADLGPQILRRRFHTALFGVAAAVSKCWQRRSFSATSVLAAW